MQLNVYFCTQDIVHYKTKRKDAIWSLGKEHARKFAQHSGHICEKRKKSKKPLKSGLKRFIKRDWLAWYKQLYVKV